MKIQKKKKNAKNAVTSKFGITQRFNIEYTKR